MANRSLIAITIFVLLFLLPISCINVPSPTLPNVAPITMLTYTNSIYGITIQYPQDWLKLEDASAGVPVAFVVRPKESDSDTGRDGIQIIVSNISVPETLDVYTQNLIQEQEQSRHDFKLIDSTSTTLAGNPAHKIVFTSKIVQHEVKSMYVYTIKNNNSYTVIYSAQSYRYPDSLGIVQQMIDSFEIIPGVSPPSYGPLILWTCDSFNSQPHKSQQTDVAAGQIFTVYLCSDNTDYQWSKSAYISDQTVVKQIETDFTQLRDFGREEQFPRSVDRVWTFKALQKGTSTVDWEYSQIGEGGEKARWTFNLTVIVE
jgi:predicted secreted protein